MELLAREVEATSTPSGVIIASWREQAHGRRATWQYACSTISAQEKALSHLRRRWAWHMLIAMARMPPGKSRCSPLA
eukprot:6383863-Pyramimonas_sp.AAC.1